MTQSSINSEERGPMPELLKVLCILTFISTGLNALFGIINIASGPQSEDFVIEQQIAMAKQKGLMEDVDMPYFANFFDQMSNVIVERNENFYFASIVDLMTVVIGFFGALLMFRGRKIGFHLYIIYSLLSVGGIYLYISAENVSSLIIISNLVMSGAFVFMYSRSLNWLR